MTSASESSQSGVILGMHDVVGDRRSSSYRSQFVRHPLSRNAIETSERSVPIGRCPSHFFSATGECCFPKSTSASAYAFHADAKRGALAEEESKDLRVSHFSIGGGSDTSWATTHKEAFKAHDGNVKQVARFCGHASLNLFETTDFEKSIDESEFKSAFQRREPTRYVNEGAALKADARRSHISFSGSSSPLDYRTEFSESFITPGESRACQNQEIKEELRRSHLALWEGSLAGCVSETKAKFIWPPSH